MSLFAGLQALDDDKGSREEYVRAPFPYPGAKTKALKQILPLLPYRKSYIEAFGGSGAVLLARNQSDLEVFNDRYAGVTCFYRVLRTRKQELIDRLSYLIFSREEFIWCRDTWKACEDELERAARWYYSLSVSFGGEGKNFGRSTTGKNFPINRIDAKIAKFHEVHHRIRNVQIENQDWRMILKDYDSSEAVFYLDPPYWSVWKGKYECEMPDEHHTELLERIFHLKGFVAISSYDNDLYSKFPWDHCHKWYQQQSIAAMAFHESNNMAHMTDLIKRQLTTEVLYIKEAK